MYQEATSCPFPIYADPTKRLYDELGMTRTLAMGSRPEYMRKSLLSTMVMSVVQGLKQIKSGGATKGGDVHQVGGEFLFEPLSFATSLENGVEPPTPITSLEEDGEDKRVTWCHRMRNTRDHAEIPELREVLGLDGLGIPGRNSKRWDKAVGERKGTGLSSSGSAGRASQDLNEQPAPSAVASNDVSLNGH
jgi:AhpC/TSA antioxidant enzyme